MYRFAIRDIIVIVSNSSPLHGRIVQQLLERKNPKELTMRKKTGRMMSAFKAE